MLYVSICTYIHTHFVIDYGGAGNSAAYLTLNTYDEAYLEKKREAALGSTEEVANNEPNFVPNSNLMYNIHYYYINSNGPTDVDIDNLEFSGTYNVYVCIYCICISCFRLNVDRSVNRQDCVYMYVHSK